MYALVQNIATNITATKGEESISFVFCKNVSFIFHSNGGLGGDRTHDQQI
jgi:hypothetical protein